MCQDTPHGTAEHLMLSDKFIRVLINTPFLTVYVQRALGTARVWSGVVQEQHVNGGGSYYTRCALIRDRQPTAWDDFARSAEAVYPESKSSDSSREISVL